VRRQPGLVGGPDQHGAIRQRDRARQAVLGQAEAAGCVLPGLGGGGGVDEHLGQGVVRTGRRLAPGPVEHGLGRYGRALQHHRVNGASGPLSFQPQHRGAVAPDAGLQPPCGRRPGWQAHRAVRLGAQEKAA
jgi:hypothetical protein